MVLYCGWVKMATADSRYKLNLKIGSAYHYLPIYEGYSDFYNGLYVPLKVSTGYRYVPITPTQSELTANAGIIKNGTRYYFLTRAFTNNYSISNGSFYKYISGGSNSMDLTNIINVSIPVPETHKYRVTFKQKVAMSFNAHKHGYRAESQYQYVVKHNGNTLIDTGMRNLLDGWFRQYETSAGDAGGMQAVAKWMTLGTVDITLNAGNNVFQLWAAMKEHNNKHAAIFVEPFLVEIQYI